MKVLFIYDGPVSYDKDGNYYAYSFTAIEERYSLFADKIEFLMRTKPLQGAGNFSKISNKIKIIPVPNFKNSKLFFKNRIKAEKIIEENVRNAEIVVLRVPSSIAQIAFKYVCKYQKNYFVECIGCAWDSYWNHSVLGKLIAPYMEYKTAEVIKKSQFVYYVTDQFLQKHYPSSGIQVGCSDVVLSKFNEDVLQKRLEKIRKVNRKINVGTAAAIDVRFKGQEYFIKAMPKLIKKGYDIEYFLVGGCARNPNDLYLKKIAKKMDVENRVHFLGAFSADKMSEFYDSIDVYVQPSKQEGLPRAVIEALSRGCLVIGSNIAGIPELIPKNFLFKKGSVKEILLAFERLMKSDLENVVIENINKSRNYEKEKLEEKRNEFYSKFVKSLNIEKTADVAKEK